MPNFTNSASLCVWLVNVGRWLQAVIKERKLLVANFLLHIHVLGTETRIECHQTFPLCEGAGQPRVRVTTFCCIHCALRQNVVIDTGWCM